MINKLKVTDAAWVATALLHREHPGREDFAVQEIFRRAEREAEPEPLREGVKLHVSYHAVAGKPPNKARHCLLTQTARGRRRLFRPGDPRHKDRTGKEVPRAEDVPAAYGHLLDWYRREYAGDGGGDPIQALRGLGKAIWQDEDADAYVRRLREDWS